MLHSDLKLIECVLTVLIKEFVFMAKIPTLISNTVSNKMPFTQSY